MYTKIRKTKVATGLHFALNLQGAALASDPGWKDITITSQESLYWGVAMYNLGVRKFAIPVTIEPYDFPINAKQFHVNIFYVDMTGCCFAYYFINNNEFLEDMILTK